MHYVIDGYNVIKSEHSRISGGTLENQRQVLINAILQSRPQGSEKNFVTVVFDGRSEDPFSGEGYTKQQQGFVEVLFSENTTADRIIERIVNEKRGRGETVVVSDDKGIKRILGYSGAKFISVSSFWKKVTKGGSNEDRSQGIRDDVAQRVNEELKGTWLHEK